MNANTENLAFDATCYFATDLRTYISYNVNLMSQSETVVGEQLGAEAAEENMNWLRVCLTTSNQNFTQQ